MSLVAPPAGAVFQLDAYDVDGSGNVYRAHGDALRTWHDGGVGSPAELTTEDVYARPHIKKGAPEQCVSFDGIDDRFTIPGSAHRFAFLHTTGIFDLFLCSRRRRGGSGTKTIFGSLDSSTDKGLLLTLNPGGAFTVILGNGSASIVYVDGLTDPFETQFGFTARPRKFLIRGTGTSLQVSTNFHDFESRAFTGGLGSGDAARDYKIGSGFANQSRTDSSMMDADLFWASLYDRNLSAEELATMASCIVSRAGDDA